MITLTREEAQELLNALTYVGDAKDIYSDTIETFRARLAQPEPELWAGVDFDVKTTPPHREWRGLTSEEKQVAYAMFGRMSLFDFVQSIERVLKEKNAA